MFVRAAVDRSDGGITCYATCGKPTLSSGNSPVPSVKRPSPERSRLHITLPLPMGSTLNANSLFGLKYKDNIRLHSNV